MKKFLLNKDIYIEDSKYSLEELFTNIMTFD
jgi:hypothetical protein